MSPTKHVLIVLLLALHISLAVRGLWQQDKNLFTLHPFSNPLSRCTFSGSAENETVTLKLPSPSYRNVLGETYVTRAYLELVPHYEQALQTFFRRTYPDAQISLHCIPLYSAL